MTKDEIFTFFHNIGIVPVIKLDDAGKAVPLAKALMAGGIPCAEVTFRTQAAEESIKRMSAECPDILIGAGTVINPELAEKAVNAGAKFIVSAGLNPETVKWCNENNIPCVPGVCTPSEIELGLSLGLNVLKFFPAEASGGVGMLKNFQGPFGQVKFMTTGGINPSNLSDYAKAPNVLAVGGSWMVKDALINEENWDEITRLCKEATTLMQGFEIIHVGFNNENVDEAGKVAKEFEKFGFATKKGNSSTFVNTQIELCHKMFYGTHGHIAIRCNDLERAVFYLAKKGFSIIKGSEKYDAKGKLKVCYLDPEVGGFAIHLVK